MFVTCLGLYSYPRYMLQHINVSSVLEIVKYRHSEFKNAESPFVFNSDIIAIFHSWRLYQWKSWRVWINSWHHPTWDVQSLHCDPANQCQDSRMCRLLQAQIWKRIWVRIYFIIYILQLKFWLSFCGILMQFHFISGYFVALFLKYN